MTLLSTSNDDEGQEAAKHKDPNAGRDEQPDVLQTLGIAPHQLHQGIAALVVLHPMATHEGREARLGFIGGHQDVHRRRFGDQEGRQRWRRHR